jgi:hypothetical protein
MEIQMSIFKPDVQQPAAPDPVATAAAQGNMNQNTATTQQLLNMTDQITPTGSLKYDQTGTSTYTGADGKTYSVPKFQATTTLSPAEQALLDLTNKTKTNLGQIGVDQSAKIGGLLGTNVNLNTATEDKIDALGAKRLTPQFDRSEDALRTRLANQGIQPGSAAWNAEMTNFGNTKNDAFNQLYLSGRGQGVQEALTERSLPINEVTALMSGSQVTNPSFSSTPTATVAGVDYGGMVNNNFNALTSQYNTKMGQQNAEMGGMFGLAGTLGSAGISAMKGPQALMLMSDRRLKSNVVQLGVTRHGLPWYEYDIFGERQQGVMADEVRQIMPAAVVVDPASGFDMVNYSMLEAA